MVNHLQSPILLSALKITDAQVEEAGTPGLRSVPQDSRHNTVGGRRYGWDMSADIS